jgi:hypothetical protein
MSLSESYGVAEIVPELWLGPMPNSVEFAGALHDECGVTAVVSFQTRIDLLTLGFSWERMVSLLEGGGISTAERVPITDFDETSLALLLPDAIDAIQRHHEAGHVTYIHCTAGINRAPTVAIAYLIAQHQLGLDDAWDQVHAKRRVLPLRGSLERWIQRTQSTPKQHEESIA